MNFNEISTFKKANRAMRHFKYLPLVLLLVLIACQKMPWSKKERKPIFVGEPETILVEPPEDAIDVNYVWRIVDLPDASMLIPDFSSESNVFMFTADVVGDYAFGVTIMSLGDEVANYEFYFTATEDTSVVPSEAPEAAAAEEVPPSAPTTPVVTETPVPAPQPTPSTARPRTTAPPAPTPRERVTRAEPPERKAPGKVVRGHFTVQVSSWKTAKKAQAVLVEMNTQGYDAYIQRVWLEDRNEVWWRVRVGDFTHLSEARELREELAARFPECWVDNVREEYLGE
jgi:hypothetical protein